MKTNERHLLLLELDRLTQKFLWILSVSGPTCKDFGSCHTCVYNKKKNWKTWRSMISGGGWWVVGGRGTPYCIHFTVFWFLNHVSAFFKIKFKNAPIFFFLKEKGIYSLQKDLKEMKVSPSSPFRGPCSYRLVPLSG